MIKPTKGTEQKPGATSTMIRITHALALASLLCEILFLGPVPAFGTSLRSLNLKRHEVAKRFEQSSCTESRHPHVGHHATHGAAPPRVKNITFKNPEASSTYTGAHTSLLSSESLMNFQSSMLMAILFLWLTSTLAHHGPACFQSAVRQTRQERFRYMWPPRANSTCLTYYHSVILLVLASRSGRKSRRSHLLVCRNLS